MQHQVILDFDNTMGIAGCDIDDGLALLYLLGCADADILGCTCAYGNSDMDTVYANTADLFAKLHLDLPFYEGAHAPCDAHGTESARSPASRFLAETVAAHPGKIDLLVTGSTTNIMGAVQENPCFLDELCSLTFMGGITQQLVFDGAIMDELNFSCDSIATAQALQARCRVTVATAQHCLPAYFRPQEFEKNLLLDGVASGGAVHERCRYWFADMERRYGLDGFVCWDVVAAAALIQPELFDDEIMHVVADPSYLRKGFLWQGVPGRDTTCDIHTPVIRDAELFCHEMYAAWRRAVERIG